MSLSGPSRTAGHPRIGPLLWVGGVYLLMSSVPAAAQKDSIGRLVHNYPRIDLIEEVISAPHEFASNQEAFTDASDWMTRRLLRENSDNPAPYLVCAERGHGRHTLATLRHTLSKSAIQPVSNTETHGSCFIATGSPDSMADVLTVLKSEGVRDVVAGPFLSALKLAPGLLDHGEEDTPHAADERLRTTGGVLFSKETVLGLSVQLSPGVLPVQRDSLAVGQLMSGWRSHLTSESLNLYAASYWSDPDVTHSYRRGSHRASEWRRAANVVHDLANSNEKTPGQVCDFGRIRIHHVDNDLIAVEGITHLIPGSDTPDEELKMACFMGLLAQLSTTPEVLRVAPLRRAEPFNAVASAIVQSASVSQTPLHDVGLDGTGQVIQVVDTGLDETSCFFVDDDGLEVEHGHLFDGVRLEEDGSYSLVPAYNFVYDSSRRKVVQYIEAFIAPDKRGGDNSSSSSTGSTSDSDSFTYFIDYYYENVLGITSSSQPSSSVPNSFNLTSGYGSWTYDAISEESDCAALLEYYYGSATSTTSSSSPSASHKQSLHITFTEGYDDDTFNGHGTHVAGSAAGSTSPDSPYLTAETCTGVESYPTCVGGCMSVSEAVYMPGNDFFDIATYCPTYDCDGTTADSANCLGDDPLETLASHGGVAPGAKVAIFDIFYGYMFVAYHLAGNYLWSASASTGARIHSNSWGPATNCEFTDFSFLYDTFMYENPEHLLLFAAGNSGGFKDNDNIDHCTIQSMALGKNVLAVGSTTGGASRPPYTGLDGKLRYEALGVTDYNPDGYPYICLDPFFGLPSISSEPADHDTVSFFSSYGPTIDGRIKPEIVAPGEQVFSAASDGTDGHSCRLMAGTGTSMATPVTAGSAALVRQYLEDGSFYVHDVETRGLCSGRSSMFLCSEFSPSAATVKAMLINSANLMGGSTEPNNIRGFGRVHLEAGMPLGGDGSIVLFIADAAETTIGASSETSYIFTIDEGFELRATLSWLDIPTSALSTNHLQNDLDLAVTTPSGDVYTMWSSGDKDTVNVNERVIVPAASCESGTYTVSVSAGELLTDHQHYSLVVTGVISSVTVETSEGSSSSNSNSHG